jgi:hypothetical protein
MGYKILGSHSCCNMDTEEKRLTPYFTIAIRFISTFAPLSRR